MLINNAWINKFSDKFERELFKWNLYESFKGVNDTVAGGDSTVQYTLSCLIIEPLSG